jgi:hypothetical protein
MAETSFSDAHHHDELPAIFLGWNAEELRALAIALAVLAVWIGGFALVGFAGLILPALLLVLGAFVAIILISRG